MTIEHTLAIIKPNAVKKQIIGTILQRFEHAKLNIVGLKMVQLNQAQAEGFYAEHVGKPFFAELIDFMISGPVVVLVLEGENAIACYRQLMGATDFAKAQAGTLRHDYADSLTENTVHGSDSPESAEREIAYFFADREICTQ